MKKILFWIFGLLIFFIPLDSYSQIDYMGNSSSDEQSERNLFALIIVSGFTALVSSIFYFATWFTVKKILHKKYPKLIGMIVVAIYLMIILYLAISSVL